MEKFDLLVVVDFFLIVLVVLYDWKDGVYLLLIIIQFEIYGFVIVLNCLLQWCEKVVDLLFDFKVDYEIMKLFVDKFGFIDCMFCNIVMDGDELFIEDIIWEFNWGMWIIGYIGQLLECLKKYMVNQYYFDKIILCVVGGFCDGDVYGMLWLCWGIFEMNYLGIFNLYDLLLLVFEGGFIFCVWFGVECNGESLLVDGVYLKNFDIKDGYFEFIMQMLMEFGWDKDLIEEECVMIDGIVGVNINWKIDLLGGIQWVVIKYECVFFGNVKV